MNAKPDSPNMVQGKDASKYIVIECEVAPCKTASIRVPREALASHGLVRLSKRPDGSIFPVLKTWHSHERLTDDLPARLGLGMDAATLRVLCYAGFVKASRPTPFVTLIDVQSLLEHLEATEGENAADFWTEARRRRYRQAYHLSGMRLPRPGPDALPGQLDLFREDAKQD